MKRIFLLFVFTIFLFSCGYKVKTFADKSFAIKSFKFHDSFLFEFKKDIEWSIEESLQDAGFVKSSEPDFEIFVSLENIKSRTIQSGQDNRQTAKEIVYLLKAEIRKGENSKTFSDKIKVYQKFPVSSEYFVDKRKEIAKDLSNQIALRMEAWLSSLM